MRIRAAATYGHVAIVEEVKDDGSILISESNALGAGIVSYRTFAAGQASQLTYVIGKNKMFKDAGICVFLAFSCIIVV
jgi:surface antigen